MNIQQGNKRQVPPSLLTNIDSLCFMHTHIRPDALHHLLGIPPSTPLCVAAMAPALNVAICPSPRMSQRLEHFTATLGERLREVGVTLLAGNEAVGSDGRFPAGTVILAPGQFPDALLPINRVSNLYNNIIVGIYDEPAPVHPGTLPQKTLDSVVSRLAWEMVHILVYITAESWSICTMNGGVVSFDHPLPRHDDLIGTLIPKLTAQVTPPRREEIELRPGTFDASGPALCAIAQDFIDCSALWKNNPSLLTHTSRHNLAYRNNYYRKIVARYLDDRSGMSYGFFARQLPTYTHPATMETGTSGNGTNGTALRAVANKHRTIQVSILDRYLLVPVPDVRIITTRSGCRKTGLDSRHDLVETGLEGGKIYLKTPAGLPAGEFARPSFDTLAIIAHAVGNAMVSSILQALRPGSIFPGKLRHSGAAMTHWHDYPSAEAVPAGYVVHGESNPPVSCSTPQSAAYSLIGKLGALERALREGRDYLGDVHIEPHHGTNMVGTLTLAETAKIVNRH